MKSISKNKYINFLIMEYVDGCELFDYVVKNTFDNTEAMQIFK